jgi:hypothetical protein
MTEQEQRATLLRMIASTDRSAGLIEEIFQNQKGLVAIVHALESQLRRCRDSMRWAEDKLRKLEHIEYRDEDYLRASIKAIAEALGPRNPKN